MQIRAADTERIADVLTGACAVPVERDREARDANSCHLVPLILSMKVPQTFRRRTSMPQSSARRTNATAACGGRRRQCSDRSDVIVGRHAVQKNMALAIRVLH